MHINKRKAVLILFDMLCFWLIAWACELLDRFTSSGLSEHIVRTFLDNAGVLFGYVFVLRFLFGVYGTIWRYASTMSYFRMMIADVFGALLATVTVTVIGNTLGIWFFVTMAALNVSASVFSRCCYRLLYKRSNRKDDKAEERKNICIVGAGQLGVYLANELIGNPSSEYRPVCFIDKDPSKINGKISGLQIHSSEKLSLLMERYSFDTVVLAISSAGNQELNELRIYYESHGCTVKLYDLPLRNAKDSKRVIRDFAIEDVLFRSQKSLLGEEEKLFYRGKTVLITGGGGSIGSELCRCVAKCEPKKLVIFDIYENGAYDIQQELKRQYGDALSLTIEIGSVRDVARLDYVFRKYRPEIVFHAAAHKHVPLMEQSCAEAIKNNVLGTYHTADMAEKYGVMKFIQISTDKAVNPTNVMGASKRVCEMIVECRNDSKTCFSAVRFGNVLGSNGSVVPLFKEQIKNHGPITITDKRIIRYFMTIPEASQLVMTAGAMAKRGELFVLDMGNPVKIYDLAVAMIRMSGYEPEKDIMIQEVGLRPGEKLYEELLIKTEHLSETAHKLIFVEKDDPLTRTEVEDKLSRLSEAIRLYEENDDEAAIHRVLRAIVPSYRSPSEVNEVAMDSDEMRDAERTERIPEPIGAASLPA